MQKLKGIAKGLHKETLMLIMGFKNFVYIKQYDFFCLMA
jgi:hypothetical protein